VIGFIARRLRGDGGTGQNSTGSSIESEQETCVVWKLDRLSRLMRDVLTIMEHLADAEAGFRSLTEAIDTTTPVGQMMMQMVRAFAEFERKRAWMLLAGKDASVGVCPS
jgi:hypothetical protein